MPWGTHFCLFYETKDDLIETVVPYLKIGLESKEYCLWVVGKPLTAGQAVTALRHAVPTLDGFLADRSLEIIPSREWLLKRGRFDSKRVVADFHDRLRDALDRGYEGMRVSGEPFWAGPKLWPGLCTFERAFETAIAGQAMTAVCTYPLAMMRAADVLDVARTHQFTMARRRGAWEIIETPELRQAKREIVKLNDELKQRVSKRTRQLEAANRKLRAQIAERAQVEEKLQVAQAEIARVARLSAMGVLTASIAHEINQPLTAVVSNAEAALRWLLKKPPNTKAARRSVKQVVRNGNRASEVIGRIRGRLKQDRPEYAEVDLNNVVRDVLDLTQRSLQTHRVTLRTDLAEGIAPVLGDRVQLQQVVVNLIMNGIEAIEAVTNGPRELTVRTRAGDGGGVLVAIEDSGVGVATAAADHLFDPFFTTKSHGMGLGLWISRSLVEAHGGRLWHSPRAPEGSIFQISLPPTLTDERQN
jgi:C4-dicarboxylate-specific signal transduction histidine kinase